MLTQIQLKDFAVVSANELSLASGFTVVTGETGAGKSLLVDALLCLTGARAETGMVRHGAERAELAAEFDVVDAEAAREWLIEQAMDEDGQCQLRRIIRADGGSKAWINGRSASVAQLHELGALLLEIHGQHAQQSLLERRKQLGLLDEYAQAQASQQLVQRAYKNWQALQLRLQQLQAGGDAEQRLDYLTHQLQEFAQQRLEPEIIDAALAKHKRHSQAQQLLAASSSALQALREADTGSALSLLHAGKTQLSKWQSGEPELAAVMELLESADIQLKEAASQLQNWQDGIELDAGELTQLESQLTAWHELARKHRVPLEQLQAKAESLQAEFEALQNAGSAIAQTTQALREAAENWLQSAHALSTVRKKASRTLAETVTELMTELGMAGGRFEVLLEENEDATPQAHGLERVEFLVSANPGQPPKPLRKVASGGELARISLAIEVATLGLDPTPTMVFDEVDSGIGGAIADVVGRKLRALGQNRQVLCVTHLAQVASLGHQHLQVAKQHDGQQTQSQVQALQGEARVQEIARMMGGSTITPKTIAHAADMLKNGQVL